MMMISKVQRRIDMNKTRKYIYVYRENNQRDAFEIESELVSYDIERGSVALSKVEKICKIVDQHFDGDWEYYRIPLINGNYQEIHHKFHRSRD